MKLTEEQHNILKDWIERYVTPINSINHKIDTSHIRETFMQTYAKGFYLDNDTFNEMMLEMVFQAAHFSAAPYLHFNISNQSQFLREYRQWALNPSAYQKCE